MKNRLVILFLFITILFGCNIKSNSKQIITIATLKGPSAMGMIKLIDSLNQVSDNSIKVEILNEPIQVRKMVIDGTADFAILPTTMAAILFNRGVDYKLSAIPVWGTLYLFGTDTTITNWEMLRGKTINLMAKGMTPDVLFKHLLIKNGINPDTEVRLDYRFPTHIDLANAVAAGQATLGVISEPLVSLVLERNSKVKAIFDLNAEWEKVMDMPIAQTAFFVKGELVDTNKELVNRILKSYEYSTQWVNDNPDSAAKLIVKYDILPSVEVARNSIPRSNLHFVRACSIRREIESYLNVFYQMNPDIVGGRLPDENFYH
jgi:NitT/TauT family transport system substrate-binding protein